MRLTFWAVWQRLPSSSRTVLSVLSIRRQWADIVVNLGMESFRDSIFLRFILINWCRFKVRWTLQAYLNKSYIHSEAIYTESLSDIHLLEGHRNFKPYPNAEGGSEGCASGSSRKRFCRMVKLEYNSKTGYPICRVQVSITSLTGWPLA